MDWLNFFVGFLTGTVAFWIGYFMGRSHERKRWIDPSYEFKRKQWRKPWQH